jgi:hypothetical protein
MTKYANEGAGGARRAASYGKERAPLGGNITEPAPRMKVDASVRLGDINTPILGNVPMETQMRKPAAYQPKKGTP